MKTNRVHQMVIDETDFVEVIYRDGNLNHLVVENTAWAERFQNFCMMFDIPVEISWEEESTLGPEEFVESSLADWNLPEAYEQFDVENYVLSKCTTPEQRARVELEMREFKQRNMLQVLQFLKYFVDVLTKHDMVWGVGRGSSVASYVLYLLKVHRVDALEYGLDIKEFLK